MPTRAVSPLRSAVVGFQMPRLAQMLVPCDRLPHCQTGALGGNPLEGVACKGTFTGYPDFALPYKRYVRQDLC